MVDRTSNVEIEFELDFNDEVYNLSNNNFFSLRHEFKKCSFADDSKMIASHLGDELFKDSNFCEERFEFFKKYELINEKDLKHLINDPNKRDSITRDYSALQFVSPNVSFGRKLHAGSTPFVESFENSPICMPKACFRMSSLFMPRLCGESSVLSLEKSNIKNSVNFEKKNIVQLNSYSNCNETAVRVLKIEPNEVSVYIKLLFANFFFLNERSVVLRAVDEDHLMDLDIGNLNPTFISCYNSFHFFVTFHEVIRLDHFMDITLYRARHIFDSRLYCIKVSRFNQLDARAFDQSSRLLHNEVLTLSRLNHENIMRYYCSWIEYQTLYEQVEYHEGGTLESFVCPNNLKLGKLNFLKNRAVVYMLTHILSALNYLHIVLNFAHNDVAAYNIFLCHEGGQDCEGDMKWRDDSLLKRNVKFQVIFKLAGFENSAVLDNEEVGQNDVQDLAIVSSEALGERPSAWKGFIEKNPTRQIKMKRYYQDKKLPQLLQDAVLGKVRSARDLLNRVNLL